MAKVSKGSVSYRRSASPQPWQFGKRCGNCVMFRAPESCTLVAGRIRRQDVCDRWAAR